MTRDAIALRRYRPEDLEATVDVWRRSKRAAFPYVAVQQRYSLDDDTAHFRDVIAVTCDVWLAEVDGRVAGLLAPRGELIDQLFVDVDCQGRGVGTALLRAAMQRSPNRLRLFTFQRNPGARAFYERHGFRAEHFGVSAPPENEPDVEYVWPSV